MDESLWYHPLCLCHEDGNGDDTPRCEVVKPEKRHERSLDVVVIPTVIRAIIPLLQVSQCSISFIVPKAKLIATSLRPTQYKVGGSFEIPITIGSDNKDDELNITAVVDEVPTVVVVEGAEKKVSPEEY